MHYCKFFLLLSAEGGAMTDTARYSIEANVGKNVVGKLLPGGVVRIGKNGKLLHGAQTPTNQPDFYVKYVYT